VSHVTSQREREPWQHAVGSIRSRAHPTISSVRWDGGVRNAPLSQRRTDDAARHGSDFVAEAPVSHLRALRDAKDETGFSRDLWKQFAEMGFTGVLVPEAQGGLGLGHVEAGVVLEEIGRNLSPSPFLSTAVAAVARAEGTAHADRWFPASSRATRSPRWRSTKAPSTRDRIAMTAERSATAFASPAPSSSSTWPRRRPADRRRGTAGSRIRTA
jgi:alkylation response protein AidB-like acyl-CoA dehydrogenase